MRTALTLPLCFVLTTLFSASARADVGGQWQSLPPMVTARQECGAARLDPFVYVAGGLLSGPGLVATASVERMNIATGAWSGVAPIPAPRDHHGVCALNGLLYVIGGFNGDFVPKSEVWAYAPGTNTWSPRAALPAARGACWAVAHGQKIYVFGGTNPGGGISNTTFVYDPGTNTWTTGASMPTPREHLMAASLGAFIHVVGGRNGSGSFNVHERYDPVLNSWTTLPPMPSARSASGMAGFAGRLYVMGGEVPVLSSKNEVYDPVTNAWTAQEPMPIPRHGVGAVTLDDRILLPAGGVVQGLQPTNAVDSFLPLANGARHFCDCATNAPCGNTFTNAGCANSTGAGAKLTATGTASVSADTVVLRGTAMPATSTVLYFQGTAQINGGLGFTFGDGKRCAGGTVVRLGVKTNAGGMSTWPSGGDPSVSVRGSVPAGATRHYQAWYRNMTGPCGSAFNLTNAVTIDWGS